MSPRWRTHRAHQQAHTCCTHVLGQGAPAAQGTSPTGAHLQRRGVPAVAHLLGTPTVAGRTCSAGRFTNRRTQASAERTCSAGHFTSAATSRRTPSSAGRLPTNRNVCKSCSATMASASATAPDSDAKLCCRSSSTRRNRSGRLAARPAAAAAAEAERRPWDRAVRPRAPREVEARRRTSRRGRCGSARASSAAPARDAPHRLSQQQHCLLRAPSERALLCCCDSYKNTSTTALLHVS